MAQQGWRSSWQMGMRSCILNCVRNLIALNCSIVNCNINTNIMNGFVLVRNVDDLKTKDGEFRPAMCHQIFNEQ